MKKIFLLLACVATLSACNTNTGGEDPLITRYKQIGALFYLGTLNQLAYNLDPFDMAFRLNTLITETQNEGGSLDDLNSSALKTRLFGATTITKEGPVYTLSLATVAPDDIRSGNDPDQYRGRHLERRTYLDTVFTQRRALYGIDRRIPRIGRRC